MTAGVATRILGIDPGSRLTGFGIIESAAGKSRALAYDVIKLGDGPLPGRLLLVMQRLRQLCAEWRPDEVAMEQVFVKKNVSSALVLGQARGVAICAVAEAGLALHEYAPASIKLAIAGAGRAEKAQMQHMVKVLLNLPAKPAEDAADALACALCHAHSRTLKLKTNNMLQGQTSHGRGR
jgi:crossover junction endodeoxyribonuclease RuvC